MTGTAGGASASDGGDLAVQVVASAAWCARGRRTSCSAATVARGAARRCARQRRRRRVGRGDRSRASRPSDAQLARRRLEVRKRAKAVSPREYFERESSSDAQNRTQRGGSPSRRSEARGFARSFSAVGGMGSGARAAQRQVVMPEGRHRVRARNEVARRQRRRGGGRRGSSRSECGVPGGAAARRGRRATRVGCAARVGGEALEAAAGDAVAAAAAATAARRRADAVCRVGAEPRMTMIVGEGSRLGGGATTVIDRGAGERRSESQHVLDVKGNFRRRRGSALIKGDCFGRGGGGGGDLVVRRRAPYQAGLSAATRAFLCFFQAQFLKVRARHPRAAETTTPCEQRDAAACTPSSAAAAEPILAGRHRGVTLQYAVERRGRHRRRQRRPGRRNAPVAAAAAPADGGTSARRRRHRRVRVGAEANKGGVGGVRTRPSRRVHRLLARGVVLRRRTRGCSAHHALRTTWKRHLRATAARRRRRRRPHSAHRGERRLVRDKRGWREGGDGPGIDASSSRRCTPNAVEVPREGRRPGDATSGSSSMRRSSRVDGDPEQPPARISKSPWEGCLVAAKYAAMATSHCASAPSALVRLFGGADRGYRARRSTARSRSSQCVTRAPPGDVSCRDCAKRRCCLGRWAMAGSTRRRRRRRVRAGGHRRANARARARMSTGAAPEWLARARGGAAASDAPTTDAARAPMRARRRPTSTSGGSSPRRRLGTQRSRARPTRTRSPSRGMTCRHARRGCGRERTDADATVQDGTQLRHVARKTTRSSRCARRPKAIFSPSSSAARAQRRAHAVRELARRARGAHERVRGVPPRAARAMARALPETAPVRRRPPGETPVVGRDRPSPRVRGPSARVLTSVDLARWIEARGADVELVRCEGDDTPDVASSAAALGVDVSQIVKSLVFAADGAFVVVVSNGETRVDVKKLARALGVANRRVRLATPRRPSSPPASCPGRSPVGHRAPLSDGRSSTPPCPSSREASSSGGGGDGDMEVRADVRELLRLTNARRGPQGVPEEVPNPEQAKNTPAKNTPAKNTPKNTPKNTTAKHTSASAPTATATSQKLASAYDERVGTERRPLSRDVVEVLGVTPTARHRGGEAAAGGSAAVASSPRCWSVRRVARLLAFATLRPLGAPVTVEQRGRARRAARRASEGVTETNARLVGDVRRGPPAAGTELRGRGTFPHGVSRWRVRDGDDDRARRQGDEVEVEGRLQANPRPMTVDIVVRR